MKDQVVAGVTVQYKTPHKRINDNTHDAIVST